ncbi:MAG: superoxide dismutase [Planctomycetaceae bacterium]|nr:superoxide dismutase [Planctomycetaceae bacterium]
MSDISRRSMLSLAATGAAVTFADTLFGTTIATAFDGKPAEAFSLPALPYAFDALAPHIDEQTMRIHHGKHHQAYINNLNAVVAETPGLKGKSLEDLLRGIDEVPSSARQKVINHGGGHANHMLFWEVMSPQGGGEPAGNLAKAITRQFESFANFRDQFSAAAGGVFGSGWAWLVVNHGQLEILSTANQDSPLMKGAVPVLGIDVWEHAYYLNYQNRRPDYVKAWFNVVNWDQVGKNYAKAIR